MHGFELVSAAEAATMLGVKKRQVYVLMAKGKLPFSEIEGRRWPWLMFVESRAERMSEPPKGKPVRPMAAAGVGDISAGNGELGQVRRRDRLEDLTRDGDAAGRSLAGPGSGGGMGSPMDEIWVSLTRAADELGVSRSQVSRLARGGKIRRIYGRYLLGDVVRLVEQRMAKQCGTGPEEWARRRRQPYVRTKLEAPTGDCLISVREAAAILGAAGSTVLAYVSDGRLFGWQERPGKHGCPVYLSEKQVRRYAADPERVRRRAAYERGAGRVDSLMASKPPAARSSAANGDHARPRELWSGHRSKTVGCLGGMTAVETHGRAAAEMPEVKNGYWRDGSVWRVVDEEFEERFGGQMRRGAGRPVDTEAEGRQIAKESHSLWMEEIGLAQGVAVAKKPYVERDYGEYYTTAQVMRELGVAKGSVWQLMRSGRLTGYRRPRTTQDANGRKWWFFRKEEVLALKAGV